VITNAIIDSAISIAERRAKRAGSSIYAGRPLTLIERGLYAAKSSNWLVIVSGFVEPVLYLLSFGFGIGQLIGDMQDGNGNPVSYAAFIAPALLATSAMNGAIYDSTWNVFFKMHFGKIYQVMLSSSMGPLDVALGLASRFCLCPWIHGDSNAAWVSDELVGIACDSSCHADCLRVCLAWHGRHLVHEEFSANELGELLFVADVLVFGNVLSGERLPGLDSKHRDGVAAMAGG
jgi:hypothetical protein